jgi:hypothetical protein
MPVLTAAACIPTVDCPIVAFPQATESCVCNLSVGGVNALYFFPCTAEMTEENILDLEWWTSFVEGSGLAGLATISGGLGSIAKKTDKKERVSSCRVEQLISTTWALTYVIKCFDKSSARTTNDQVNALITRMNNYILIARMCDGNDTILPIGPFTTSDFNWTVPDNFEEFQSMTVELSWLELGLPVTYDVAGLSAVLPKSF